METLGSRLKELRFKKGVSISDVANIIGVSPSTYRDWENERQIKGEPYTKIANYFNVSLAYLLTGEKPEIERALSVIENQVKNIRSFL